MQYAQTLAANAEHRRAADVLKGAEVVGPAECAALRWLELMRAAEKARFERCFTKSAREGGKLPPTLVSAESGGAEDQQFVVAVDSILREIEESAARRTFVFDGLCLYARATVLKAKKDKADACEAYVAALNVFPWNFSAIMDLCAVCENFREAHQYASQIGHPLVKEFFLAEAALTISPDSKETVPLFHALRDKFPNSSFVAREYAVALYNRYSYKESMEIFERDMERDKFSLDRLDYYSHMLFLEENAAKLSALAVRAEEIDKYRAETCTIVGNYYALKERHADAIIYFERAARLEPNESSPHVLLGHEYMQIQNISAAIKCYRQAIHLNPRDCRAWSGLASTYRLIHQPLYATFYQAEACRLRPRDARMWHELGQSYRQVEDYVQASRALIRSFSLDNSDPKVISDLAALFKDMNKLSLAQRFQTLYLEKCTSSVSTLLSLAEYSASEGDYAAVVNFCEKVVMTGNTQERERAKSLLATVPTQFL